MDEKIERISDTEIQLNSVITIGEGELTRADYINPGLHLVSQLSKVETELTSLSSEDQPFIVKTFALKTAWGREEVFVA